MNLYKRIQKRTYEIVEAADEGDIQSKIFDITIMVLVVLNVVCMIIETVPSVKKEYGILLDNLELIAVVIFTCEYFLRLWSCGISAKYAGLKGRVKHIFTPMAIIDLLAILPFYLKFTKIDLRAIRILRLFRIFRIAKLGRYNKGIKLLKTVLSDKKEELGLTIIIMFFMLIISSSIMYFVEHDAQPEAFSSIPAAMWWGVCTLTTVGYGDLYPVTILGKFMASFMSILGIGMFALPAGILAGGFESALTEEKQAKKECEQKENKKYFCPHCGEKLDNG